METIKKLKKEILALKNENWQLKLRVSLSAIKNKEQSDDQYGEVAFRAVFESGLGAKIIASNLKILEINRAMLALLGYDTKEKILGTTVLDYSPVEYHWHWKSLQEGLLKQSSPYYTLETCLQKKDGSVIWCNVNYILFECKNNSIGFTINENLNVKRELSLQKDEFINTAGHELKTPLTSLKAVVQLFNRIIKKDSIVTDKIVGLAHDAERYVERLHHLVGDMLNSSRIGAGQLKLSKSKMIVKELTDSFCNNIRLNGINQIVTTGNVSLEVFADKTRINQVFTNLIENADKYAPDSTEINIHVEELIDGVKVSVIDKGKGILPAYVPFLFDRYFRVNKNGNQDSGLGLGLYISAEIIRQHGGQIGVDTEAEKGSSFWFIIPKVNR